MFTGAESTWITCKNKESNLKRGIRDLLEGLRQGQLCYVLTARQMDKSSLMIRAVKMRQEGVTCVILDLTGVGQHADAERWDGVCLNNGTRREQPWRLAPGLFSAIATEISRWTTLPPIAQ